MQKSLDAEFPGVVSENPVSDVIVATEYYRDHLGFGIDWIEMEIALAGISRAQCWLFLAGPAFRGERNSPSHVSIWLNLSRKDEVDAPHRAWRSTNAILLSDPESKAWGLHEFNAADPDANRFRMFYDFATVDT